MKATLFAHNGQVTAIAFAGEAMNFNGVAVKEIEADQDKLSAAIKEVAPQGVTSPWPPVEPKAKKK